MTCGRTIWRRISSAYPMLCATVAQLLDHLSATWPARFAAAGFLLRSGGQLREFDDLASIGPQSPIDDAGSLTEQDLGGFGCGIPMTGGHDGLPL